jgi:copper resistance protein D
MIGIRLALYIDLMLLFGLPLFARYSLKAGGHHRSDPLQLRTFIPLLCITAICLSVAAIILMAADMSGVRFSAIDAQMVAALVFETAIGTAWLIRMIALGVLLLVAVYNRFNPSSAALLLICIAGLIALASLTWAGHGVVGEGFGGAAHRISNIIHLAAGGAWLGALAGFAFLLSKPVSTMSEADMIYIRRALQGFAGIGTLLVAVIIATGIINGIVIIGLKSFGLLPFSLYGQLLLIKLFLGLIMLMLAAANRFWLTPALHLALHPLATVQAIRALRRSVICEGSAAILLLAVVAWLGTLAPTGSG